MNEIYLSTGAILGRRNGFDFRVLTEHYNAFHCDGFEFMMSATRTTRMRAFPNGCAPVGRAASASPPFTRTKHIGDLLSDPDELSLSGGAGPVREEL